MSGPGSRPPGPQSGPPEPAGGSPGPSTPRSKHGPGWLPALVPLAMVLAGLSVLALLVTGAIPFGSPFASGSFGRSTGVPTTDATTALAGPTVPTRSDPLQIVALGDSVPANTGCPCPGYVADTGTELHSETHRPVIVRNDAVAGWTTDDVLADVSAESSRSTPQDLAQADLVIIQVGANDFDLGEIGDQACFPAATSSCWSPTLTALRSGLTEIADRIHQLDRNPAVRIAFLGYWNVTVDGQVAASLGSHYVANSDALTTVVNETIATVALATHSVYVDVYTPFKGENGSRDPTEDLLEDGDHPNTSGNMILTEALHDALAQAAIVKAWTAP